MGRAPVSVYMRNGTVTLATVSALGWALIIWSAFSMSSPVVALMMPMDAGWALKEIIAVWVMWAVMMGAMMLPSAIPMLVIHKKISAKRDPETPTANRWFVAAYLFAWALFCVLAAGLQWGFQRAGVLSHMLELKGTLIGGIILVAAGVFQLSPLKATCLGNCRSPMGFLLTDWRSGRAGAFQMGFKHGQYCIGCCWALMMVLFVAGVMNLTAIAVLSGIVAIEKLAPRGEFLAKLGGVAVITWGVWLVSSAWG